MAKIKVLIADDHAVLRAGLRMLIGAQYDLEVVDEAGDGQETVRRARASKPDIVLLDLSMPGPRSTQTISQLVRLDPAPRILVLTMHDDPAYCESALQAGASGYVVKKAADIELLTAIRVVYRGRTFVDLTRPGRLTTGGDVSATPSVSMTAPPRKPLSRRESEVLRLLAHGHTNQAAADRLAVSIKTVETHRKRLTDKLGLKSRAQLFRFAIESGLLEDDAAFSGND
jgi:two-component system, NarL family, response regulator NreC